MSLFPINPQWHLEVPDAAAPVDRAGSDLRSFSGSPAELVGECIVVFTALVRHTQLTNSSWQVALSSDCLSTICVCLLSSALTAAASVTGHLTLEC